MVLLDFRPKSRGAIFNPNLNNATRAAGSQQSHSTPSRQLNGNINARNTIPFHLFEPHAQPGCHHHGREPVDGLARHIGMDGC
jgi:hypothetical protein